MTATRVNSRFPFYKYETIRGIADDIRCKYAKNDDIPVDIEHIEEIGLGLEIRPIVNLKSRHDVEGMLSKDLNVIFLDNDSYVDPKYEARMRFTLAHELGHIFLHRDFYSKLTFTSVEDWIDVLQGIDESELEWAERHANEFAGRLLVPSDILVQEIENMRTEIKIMENRATCDGLTDREELLVWKKVSVSNRLAIKFRVSSQTIQTRIKNERIEIP